MRLFRRHFGYLLQRQEGLQQHEEGKKEEWQQPEHALLNREKALEDAVYRELQQMPLQDVQLASAPFLHLPTFLSVSMPERVGASAYFDMYVHPEKLRRIWHRLGMRTQWISKYRLYQREMEKKEKLIDELLHPKFRFDRLLRWPSDFDSLRMKQIPELEKMLRIAKMYRQQRLARARRGEAPFEPKVRLFGDFQLPDDLPDPKDE
ncbi:high mobility group protein [Cyclospora cayetanensis]|uniref:High mobility group protein n=1 Tax=Cyclospora cayetanensis TaxID=88456 RepID=A0A1D3D013_9EIME|nr:high mobility group protein [Cyclospora cayetanensis]